MRNVFKQARCAYEAKHDKLEKYAVSEDMVSNVFTVNVRWPPSDSLGAEIHKKILTD